jgi:peptidyl-tRNA hydrolase, PTH1 family
MKFLIAGLGNIGQEYELTRHNIGFLILDQLADQLKTDFTTDRLAYFAEGSYKGKSIQMIKPTTLMNLSGKSVNYWLQQLKVPREQLLVIVDDIALPYGKLRLRPGGANAGHNGLGSIDETLGTQEYPRLRFGIDNNFAKGRQADYVLSNFNPKEMSEIKTHIDKACEIILSFCTIGIERTMSQFNKN